MIEEFQLKAARYIMEWGEWIDKIELLNLLRVSKKYMKNYIDRLLDLQNEDGGLPHEWVKGRRSGIIETARFLEVSSKIGLNGERISKAIKFLKNKRLESGEWREEEDYEDNSGEIIVTSQVLKSIASTNIWEEWMNKSAEYILNSQRDDGLWPRSRLNQEASLEASGKALLALVNIGSKNTIKAVRNGIEGLMEVFVERTTKEWSETDEEIISVVETIITIKPENIEAVRKILNEYIKSERWNFQDRRSEDLDKLIKILRLMSMSKMIDEGRVKGEVERIIERRMRVKKLIEEKEEDARESIISRFEEIGIRRNSPPARILLGLFIYALLEQFFWAVEYDPRTEYIGIIDGMGTLDNMNRYIELENVRRALFKSKALSGVARRKKEEIAKSITLYTRFLLQKNPMDEFRKFAKSLIEYTLFEIAPTLSGTTTAKKLGLLLRNYIMNEESMEKLLESFKLSLECFPSIGSKISTLYLYYTIWVYNIWSEARRYIESPIDWNTVKTYINLGLSNLTLKDLWKDPKRAAIAINRIAEELFPEDKAKISLFWTVGREWCTKPHKCYGYMGKKCWFYDICEGRIRSEKRRKEDVE